MPPLSPDITQTSSIDQAEAVTGRAASASSSTFAHPFRLVNGLMSNGQPLPTGIGAPQPAVTPSVLAVNGLAPAGAPNPNGGTGAGLVPASGTNDTSQLWYAIPATTSGDFYLRSAESFNTNSTTSQPSTLVGFGATAVALDLGYVTNWNVSIYWNQSGSPTGDNSAFQTWQYNPNTAQLTNLDFNDQLYSATPTAAIAAVSPSPDNQWYAYPNYYLEQVIAEPNSSTPFPAPSVTTNSYGTTDEAGEQTAYAYFNTQILGSAASNSCNYEGTTYNGIRCEYTNLNATGSPLNTCSSQTLSATESVATTNPANKHGYSGAPISNADWYAVSNQLYQECSYASDVQALFQNYTTIVNAVFINNSDAVINLAGNLAVSQSTTVNKAVGEDIIVGIITVLAAATGNPAAGAVAALIAASVTTAQAAGNSNLTHPIAATVGELYGDLATNFAVLTQQANNGENVILEDWGRLQKIGPLTLVEGYNGLGITSNDISTIEAAADQGYNVWIMQQLMAVSEYSLSYAVSSTSSTIPDGPPSYDQGSYSTFGSTTGNYNIGFYSNDDTANPAKTSYPSSTVLQTDILDNGANSFELFNGINGWSGVPMVSNLFGSNGSSCNVTVATIFNATPHDLSVIAAPVEAGVKTNGWIAVPGVNGINSTSAYSAELRPYGYLPIWGLGNQNDFTVDVLIQDAGTTIASFDFGSGGCLAGSYANASNINYYDNYYWTSFGTEHQSSSGIGIPGGVWATIYNPNLAP